MSAGQEKKEYYKRSKKKAHKEATILYKKQKEMDNRMSVVQIAEFINEKYEAMINKKSIQWYV